MYTFALMPSTIVSGLTGRGIKSWPDFLVHYGQPHQVLSQQIHADHIYDVQVAQGQEYIDNYDALVTALPNIQLIIKAADCVPILVYAPDKKIIAAIHAGRKGTELRIAAQTIKYIVATYQADASAMLVSIGPSICVQCYQIDREKDIHYDLWQENTAQLIHSGITLQHIEQPRLCTHCSGRNTLYSYRGGDATLRNYAFITRPEGI